MKTNKFTNDLQTAALHTNGFAHAAGGTFGQTTTETFSERYARDRQRRVISGYRQSTVGSGRQVRDDSPRLQVPDRKPDQPSEQPQKPSADNKPVRHAFTEPTARTYNPYS